MRETMKKMTKLSIFDRKARLLKAQGKLEEEMAEEKAKDLKELQKEGAIKSENLKAKKEYDDGDNYRWCVGKTSFERLLILLKRYNHKSGKVVVEFFETSVGRVFPSPEYYTLDVAIEKMGLSKIADLINELCEQPKPFVGKPEKYAETLKKFNAKWKK